MPYLLIPLAASIVLGIVFVVLTDARPAAKAAVAVAVLGSILIWRVLPHLTVVATLIQVVACIYVLMRLSLERAGSGRR